MFIVLSAFVIAEIVRDKQKRPTGLPWELARARMIQLSCTIRTAILVGDLQMSTRSKSGSKKVSEPVGTVPRLSGRKKTLRLDQALLDSARRALGVRTETDAVTRALEAVVRRERQVQALAVLAALGPVDAERVDD